MEGNAKKDVCVGRGCCWRGPSFLDKLLFVAAGMDSCFVFLPPAVEMRQSIIKHGDDRGEVI